jgi:hypothetical protein
MLPTYYSKTNPLRQGVNPFKLAGHVETLTVYLYACENLFRAID